MIRGWILAQTNALALLFWNQIPSSHLKSHRQNKSLRILIFDSPCPWKLHQTTTPLSEQVSCSTRVHLGARWPHRRCVRPSPRVRGCGWAVGSRQRLLQERRENNGHDQRMSSRPEDEDDSMRLLACLDATTATAGALRVSLIYAPARLAPRSEVSLSSPVAGAAATVAHSWVRCTASARQSSACRVDHMTGECWPVWVCIVKYGEFIPAATFHR